MTAGRRCVVFSVAAVCALAVLIGRVDAREAPAPTTWSQLITVLYQNFPNPFPTMSSASTCLWFDLSADSDVTLAVYDLRGRLVRTIIPSADIGSHLASGSYGRLTPGGNAGCDSRFVWDGRGSDGHYVPPGVYLARLRANGHWQTKKMVFRGR